MNEAIAELATKLLRYFCASFPEAVADDLVQETLLRLTQKMRQGSYRDAQGTVTAYAFGIAHWVKMEAFKTRRKDLLHTTLDEEMLAPKDSLTDEEYLSQERAKQLRQAIAKLKDVEQSILTLLIEEDLQLEEIAQILHVPINTVKSHVHRAKANLKKLLERG